MIRGKPVPLEDKLTDLFPLSLTHVSTFVALLGTAEILWSIHDKASMDWSRLKDIICYI